MKGKTMTMESGLQVTDEIRARCEAFVGRSRVIEDTLAPEPAEKLATLLGHDLPGDALPPTYHWAYFASGIPSANLSPDLHEKTGIFLPPAPFHRRMWAGGEVSVLQPLRIGLPATKRSKVAAVTFKEGKSGQMCFVTLSHEIEQESIPCISETQTIVYRDRGAPEKTVQNPDAPLPEGYFTHPDSQLWFYSAVTHNGHRIHWDRHYCREVEGYPDLVVHGPLMATELCEAMRDEALLAQRLTYRAQAPVFATTPVRIVLGVPRDQRSGEVQRLDGVTAMVAKLTKL